MSKNPQTRTPFHPNPTGAAFPELCTTKPTLLMTIWKNHGKR